MALDLMKEDKAYPCLRALMNSVCMALRLTQPFHGHEVNCSCHLAGLGWLAFVILSLHVAPRCMLLPHKRQVLPSLAMRLRPLAPDYRWMNGADSVLRDRLFRGLVLAASQPVPPACPGPCVTCARWQTALRDSPVGAESLGFGLRGWFVYWSLGWVQGVHQLFCPPSNSALKFPCLKCWPTCLLMFLRLPVTC